MLKETEPDYDLPIMIGGLLAGLAVMMVARYVFPWLDQLGFFTPLVYIGVLVLFALLALLFYQEDQRRITGHRPHSKLV